MTYKDIAAVSGKPGIYRIVKPTRNGVILESLDEQKKRFIAGMNLRISVLQEVSIFTTSEEGVISIEEVFYTMHQKYGNQLPVDQRSDGNDLTSFLGEIVDNFDREKVYTSDIRKLISWYMIISSQFPELLTKADEAAPAPETEPAEPVKVKKASAPKKGPKSAKA